MKTIVILGASGVIGQHMRLCIPKDVKPIWVRHTPDRMHFGMDLADEGPDPQWPKAFTSEPVHAIVNLAGQGSVDEVGQDPDKYHYVNVQFPALLAKFCQRRNIHYVHVSSQAVFNGENPPYSPDSQMSHVNVYGAQKIEAEQRVRQIASGWTIVRPSFVIGVRPMPHAGRQNPIEQMAQGTITQVADRWFTADTADDVAKTLWEVAVGEPRMGTVHVAGTPRVSRYDLAIAFGGERFAARHEDFGLSVSPRPKDTTFAEVVPDRSVQEMVSKLRELYLDRKARGIKTRARELSLFTGFNEGRCEEMLKAGFFHFHHAVAADYRRFNPQNDDELLEWYRETLSYVWELTAYHLDKGFNYSGMCEGIVNTLIQKDCKRVLVLGDGIGDMTLVMRENHLDAVYHDLAGSMTERFARMRLWMYLGEECETALSIGWAPPHVLPYSYDAVVTADFLEHVTDVEKWARWIAQTLKPGGLLFAQNAFNCGSGPDGSIPMHLKRNDRFEHDWIPLLKSLGLNQQSDNWYKKEGEVEPFASQKAV